jgi:hypothetical protein
MSLAEKLNTKITKITVIISGIFIVLILQIVFDYTADMSKSKHEKSISQLSDKLKLEEQTLLVERDNEMKRIYGETPEQICNNPCMNIKEMIEAVTMKGLKQDDSVKVSVDNFIEYGVAVKFKNKPEEDVMGNIAKIILTYCDEYVNSITFYFDDNIVFMLTKKEIDNMKNRKNTQISGVNNIIEK